METGSGKSNSKSSKKEKKGAMKNTVDFLDCFVIQVIIIEVFTVTGANVSSASGRGTACLTASASPDKPKPRDQSQAESIVGYVKNVSPCRLSAKGSEYFSFNVVAKTGTVKALCFSPKRHKRNVDQKAESGVPSKITKFNSDKKDKDVIFINYDTNVEEAGETSVDFSLASAGQNRQEQSAKQVKVNIKQCHSSIF